MNIDQKEQLSMHGDMGLKASAIRLMAARFCTESPSQLAFANACDVGATTYNNMEKALNYPNRKVMKYLYRGHRIDFNFLMNGDFSQLPEDVQTRLFEKLRIAHDEWDQKSS